MPDGIVVVGAGGFGRETLDVIEAVNAALASPRWAVIGLADDALSLVHADRLLKRGYVHLGTIGQVLSRRSPAWYVIGIGNPAARHRVATEFDAAGWRAATIIHPSAVVGSDVSVARGSVVCGGVQLSTNTRLGQHVHVNAGAIVGHDTVLDDFVSVNPGAVISGEVAVGAGVLIGANAAILQGLTVAEGCIVGASACVVESVPERVTVVGVPARVLRSR